MGKIFYNLQCHSMLQRLDTDYIVLPQRCGTWFFRDATTNLKEKEICLVELVSSLVKLV